jgi:hypothetical protein
MERDKGLRTVWWMVWCVLGAFLFLDLTSAQASPAGVDADALRARYVALKAQLADNAFQRPLVLDSRQDTGALKGDVHAVVDHAFPAVQSAVSESATWCEILILHINVKQCAVANDAQGEVIAAAIGRKHAASSAGAHQVAFQYRVTARSADYLRVELSAASGPMGTSDYRIVLEALPVDGRRTFLHLSYAYAYGATAAMAMRAYFNTAGSSKVGFTVVNRQPDGQPVYVGDVRGALERNTMRNFLAIDAYLNANAAPAERRFERRLDLWFAATELYPQQLREIERTEYLAQKRGDMQRVAVGR